MTSAPTAPAAALIAEAIARIEARRDALDRLADKGLEMIDRLVGGETIEIADRKPFASPDRAFDVISRAVRLCLALACRLDEEIIALLQGGPIPNLAILSPEPRAVPTAPKTEPKAPAPARTPRERIADAVDAVIEAEVEDREAAERHREFVRERLIEGEDYDAFLHQPWRVVVQTICADLGLKPDWTMWDDDEGFRTAPGAHPPSEAKSEISELHLQAKPP